MDIVGANVRGPMVSLMKAWIAPLGPFLLVLLLGPGASANPGPISFVDLAPAVGVDFIHAGEVHPPGDATWPAYPEILGSGACWADLDGDGYDDLFIVNQAYNVNNPAAAAYLAGVAPTDRLYHNLGDGTFEDVTAASGDAASPLSGYGCSAADYDGDRLVDILVTNYGGPQLLRNTGGLVFEDVTTSAGLAGPGACGIYECWSTASAWADYDRDGDLDLFVANYVDTTHADRQRGPTSHAGQRSFLFQNDGNGAFSDVAAQAGVYGRPTDQDGTKSLGAIFFDYDLDGWQDLYLAIDEQANILYHNARNGTFTEVSSAAGVDDRGASMGIDAADYDNDGYPDLFMTHYSNDHNGFYRNRGDGTFERRSGEDDLAHSFDRVGWGTSFVDVDRDGLLDLVVANGHTEWLAPDYRQDVQVFRQVAQSGAEPRDALWVDMTPFWGPGLSSTAVHRGAAFADYDLDGRTDIALTNQANGAAQLLKATGAVGNTLSISLDGEPLNRFGVGSRIVVEVDGVSQTREVKAGSSFLSQNSLRADFGLGAATTADRVMVYWPEGGTTALTNIPAGFIRIDKTTGTYVTDTVSPVTRADLSATLREGWATGPVEIGLTAVDRGTPSASGIRSTFLSVDGGPFEPRDRVIVSTPGAHGVAFYSVDEAGNQEPTKTLVFGIDSVGPTTSIQRTGAQKAGWWVSAIGVELSATDDLSGVAVLDFRLDGREWTTYGGPLTIAEEGRHRLEFFAKDVGGNPSAVSVVEFPIDLTAPEITWETPRAGELYVDRVEPLEAGSGPAVIIARPHGEGGYPIAVATRLSDPESGVAAATFAFDGIVVATRTGSPYSWTWDASASPSGHHVLSVQAVDKVGHASESSTEVLLVTWRASDDAERVTEGTAPPAFFAPPLLLAGMALAIRRKRE